MYFALATIYFTILFTELGDRTQISTMLFAAERQYPPIYLFLTILMAFTTTTAISMCIGHYCARYIDAVPIKLIAGILLIAMGIWRIVDHFQEAAQPIAS